MVKEKRVLPADVYDTLELSAWAYGGIGGGSVYDYSTTTPDVPNCIVGHAVIAANERHTSEPNPIMKALQWVGIGVLANDRKVAEINSRVGGREPTARVSFADWTKAFNIVRGD